MCQYHFVHHISHMGWPRIKPGPLHNRPVSKCLDQRMWHSLTQTWGVSKKALSHVTNYSHSSVSSGEKDVSSGWSFIYLMVLFQQPRLCSVEFRYDLWQINKKICRKQHTSLIVRYHHSICLKVLTKPW